MQNVALGMYHTCMIDNFNTISCQEYNDFGQLVAGTTSDASEPTQTKGFNDGFKEPYF